MHVEQTLVDLSFKENLENGRVNLPFLFGLVTVLKS